MVVIAYFIKYKMKIFVLTSALLGICVIYIVISKINGIFQSKETRLFQHLTVYRACVEQFHADTGMYPRSLRDVASPSANPPAYLKPGKYKGPYMHCAAGFPPDGIPPRNPLLPEHLPLESALPPSDPPVAHWSYNPKTGKVLPGCLEKTEDGKDYRDL